MLSDNGDSQLEPTVMLLSDVLEDIARGRLRVPNFQRPFVWRPEQMLELFDSIERGYPVGSILLWETTDEVASLPQIGDVELPPAPTDRAVSYVLDGHQRLSTLFGVLRRPGRPPRPDDQREWKWRVYRDLEPKSDSDRYRHHRASGSPPAAVPTTFLPVRSIETTRDFLGFARRLELGVRDRDRVDRLIDEADTVAQRIKRYKITLIRLRGGRLGEAVEVYTRLNRRGVRMDADQVVSALTHRGGLPPLGARIDEIVESVASTDFGELPRLAVFRSVLAVANEADVMSPRWEKIAERVQNRLVDAVEATARAVHAAVDLLRWAGLPLASLLPYAHQLVVLAVFFHHCPKPSPDQQIELRKWFWVTSWAGSFAGANSTTLRHALAEMQNFAVGRGRLTLDLAEVRPMPDAFNLNSARTLAYVAWEAEVFPRRLDVLGQGFDVVRRLAAGAAQAYRPIFTRDGRAANRLILPTIPGTGLKQALKALPTGPDIFSHDDDRNGPSFTRSFLASHGIPEIGWRRLLDDEDEDFLRHRTRYLEGKMRAFARGVGVTLDRDMLGVADDDTAHE